MMVWAENELLPQVHRVNVSGCEVGLFLLTHGFIQTFMEKTYEQRGVGATTAFLKQFIDGARKKDRFSLIGPEMHEMRNVMAHQLYSSRTHDIAFDYRLNTGWDRVSGILHVNPRIYGDRFIGAIDGGRFCDWRRFTTRVQLTRQKYRFIRDWLDLPKGDTLRDQIDQLVKLPNLTAMRPAERVLRQTLVARYAI